MVIIRIPGPEQLWSHVQAMEACVGTGKAVTKMHNAGEHEGTLTYALGSQLATRAGKTSWAGEC